jgi:uncharacterized membrane protein YhaH (DUF805 family)
MDTIKKLFSFRGEVSGRDYLFWGVTLFLVKAPLDWIVARYVVGMMDWTPLAYFSVQFNPLFRLKATWHEWGPMLAVAAPFLWMGLALTVQRLRALRRPPVWAVFFFVPFLNMLFFLTLVKMEPAPEPIPGSVEGPLDRFVPESQLGCILLSWAITLASAGAGYVVSARLHMPYGSTVFFAIPFLTGYLTRLLIGYRHNVSFGGALWWAGVSQVVCAAVLVSFAIEGLFCVMIALPVVLPIAMMGGAIAHVTGDLTFPNLKGKTLCAVGVLPLALAVDLMHCYNNPGLRAAVTTVNIRATPARIWPHLVAFPRIDRPDAAQDIFDRFMIPRLQGAVIEGQGPGAIRRCIFHTGEFVEPIEVWEPGRELTFGVTAQPARLEGCVNVRRGQFKFVTRTDGSTTVIGTTWYEVSLFPGIYWDLWMQQFLHATHRRALEHIRDLAEQRSY